MPFYQYYPLNVRLIVLDIVYRLVRVYFDKYREVTVTGEGLQS